MDLERNIKSITSLYGSCNKCGLATINCICDKVAAIKSKAEIWIISTEREVYRPSNTARLLKLINPDSTEIFIWERTKQPEKLVQKINDDRYEVFLLFPTEEDELRKRRVDYKTTGKIPAFIIIDGTWKEARKILSKSTYLKELPIISLEPNYKSTFDLRRGAGEGNLCTIEAAIEVLKLNEEIESSLKIKKFYSLFLKSFKASISGHKLTVFENDNML